MRKLIAFGTLMVFAFLAKAQSSEFHAFKFDIGGGYALPASGSGTEAGATFTLQPHYRLTDEFAVGLRYEVAAIGYANTVTGDFKVSALVSGCATAEYYLSNESFRPFVGAGVGVFDQASASSNSNTDSTNFTQRKISLGGFPEVGFEIGHFRFSVAYNLAGGGSNYISFNVGAFFGGGRQ